LGLFRHPEPVSRTPKESLPFQRFQADVSEFLHNIADPESKHDQKGQSCSTDSVRDQHEDVPTSERDPTF